eukprot:TRINITY_DN68190_c4_g1_i16.p1 TRINITY_DN68190_c4_g1~~TRINITY_DN68190_c4_g1_i16.p1  ORF type:complete len:132 (+),score=11.52 TRINITY_DN68190_c4_g1_i16:282-677(+)
MLHFLVQAPRGRGCRRVRSARRLGFQFFFVSRGLQILHMRFQLRPRVLEDVLGVLGVPAAEALLAARLAEVAVHAVGGGERVLDCDQLSRPSSCRAQDWLAARVRRSPRVLAVDLDVVQQVSYVAPRCSLS